MPRHPPISTVRPHTLNQQELPAKISCHENTSFPAVSREMSTIRDRHDSVTSKQLNELIIKQVSLDTPPLKCMHSPTKLAINLLAS